MGFLLKKKMFDRLNCLGVYPQGHQFAPLVLTFQNCALPFQTLQSRIGSVISVNSIYFFLREELKGLQLNATQIITLCLILLALGLFGYDYNWLLGGETRESRQMGRVTYASPSRGFDGRASFVLELRFS